MSGWSPNDMLTLHRLHHYVAAPHGGRWNCCVRFQHLPTQYCRKLKTNNCGCGCVFLNPMTPFCPWKTSDDLKTTGSRGLIIPHSCSSFVGGLRVNSSSANARAQHGGRNETRRRRPACLHHIQPLVSGQKTYLGFLSSSLCDSLLIHLFFHTKLHQSSVPRFQVEEKYKRKWWTF